MSCSSLMSCFCCSCWYCCCAPCAVCCGHNSHLYNPGMCAPHKAAAHLQDEHSMRNFLACCSLQQRLRVDCPLLLACACACRAPGHSCSAACGSACTSDCRTAGRDDCASAGARAAAGAGSSDTARAGWYGQQASRGEHCMRRGNTHCDSSSSSTATAAAKFGVTDVAAGTCVILHSWVQQAGATCGTPGGALSYAAAGASLCCVFSAGCSHSRLQGN